MYISTKTYTHSLGLSACFRQHKADSHCRFLHGYALEIRIEFQAEELDQRNWVVDFGGLKSFKAMLEGHFDHKLLVARDDPQKDALLGLGDLGIAEVIIVDAVGCEAFAKMVYDMGERWLFTFGYRPRVAMRSVEVREHGGNSAIYDGE